MKNLIKEFQEVIERKAVRSPLWSFDTTMDESLTDIQQLDNRQQLFAKVCDASCMTSSDLELLKKARKILLDNGVKPTYG